MKSIKRPDTIQKMPENAKRVFTGVIYDVYQWQQELFDGSKTTFEKLKRNDTVVIIPVTQNGKVLIINHQQPGRKSIIDLPGGRLDYNEDVVEGAKRELLEETGYVATKFKLLDAIQPIARMDWVVYLIVAQECKRTSKKSLEGGEKIDTKIVSYDRFIEMLMKQKFTDQIELENIVLRSSLSKIKMEKLRKRILS